MKQLLLLIFTLCVLGGCSPRTQFTSGQSYLSSYNSDVKALNPDKKMPLDFEIEDEIKKAASIEPLLRFPARIGLAKLVQGKLVDFSDDELSTWDSFGQQHKKFGEFVPVNVLGTAGIARNAYGYNSDASIESIRIAAARQHLQAVLIFEINSVSDENNTALAVADLTIVGGAFLPTRILTAESHARALLVDVRNGYPYGSANSDSRHKKYSSSWGSTERRRETRDAAKAEAWEALVPQTQQLFLDLYEKNKK